jgi:hypothetical protein
LALQTLATPVLGADDVAEAMNAGLSTATSVEIATIVTNGIVRIAAIAAGVYIVWLGHNTMVRGVRGEFEFEGKLGKLKGSVPGLLFVLLGSAVVGWALQTKVSGEIRAGMELAGSQHGGAGTSIEPPLGQAGGTIPPPPQ